MFVNKISSAINFGQSLLSNNFKDNANVANKNYLNNASQINDNQKLDLLVKKMNDLQLDVEKMRARQMLADRIVTTGKLNLMSKGNQSSQKSEFLNEIC